LQLGFPKSPHYKATRLTGDSFEEKKKEVEEEEKKKKKKKKKMKKEMGIGPEGDDEDKEK
jgi:hypothetical protein